MQTKRRYENGLAERSLAASIAAASESDKLAPWMFRLALLCQLATIWITWPVWSVRQRPINLPLWDLPNVPFGAAMLASLAAAFFFPRAGTAIHAGVFAVSCLFDQTRMQPQVASMIVLMWACTSVTGAWFARWYLAAMWLWAGIHKAVSPEWFGVRSWDFVAGCGLNPEQTHVAFAAIAAATEIALGIGALVRPRWAAFGCAAFHLGVILTLSPMMTDQNVSVWPWNFATAAIGAWLLWTTPRRLETLKPVTRTVRFAAIAALFIAPAGFYTGWVNPHWTFVLYSGQLPHALHVSPTSLTRLNSWTGLTVPFPDSPRLFREVFRRTGQQGDKLHIHDPRFAADSYYLHQGAGAIREISREEFHRSDAPGEVVGVEIESRNASWRLARLGAKIERDKLGLANSITLSGRRLGAERLGVESLGAEVLTELAGLPNLREVKIEGAALDDRSLEFAAKLPRLEVLELKSVSIGNCSLAALAQATNLQWLRIEKTKLPREAISDIASLQRLEVLQLVDVGLKDASALSSLKQLKWLDLSYNPLNDSSLAALANLADLEILNLSSTSLGAAGLAALPTAKLQVLNLSGTSIGDDELPSLFGLTNCRKLNLRETSVTSAGLAELRANLPRCGIEE